MIGYPNVPALIGNVVASGRATLYELQTFYGVEDAYDLLEIAHVDGYNEAITIAAGQKES